MTTVEQETLPVTLKPCPFCGAHDEFNPSVSQSHKYAEPGNAATGKVANLAAGLVPAGWYVECDECGGLGGQADDRAAAITAWNTRADHEPRAVEVGLREAIARIIEPNAWCRYDARLRPFVENRGAHEGESWHVRAYQAGCRNAEDARRWWLETATDIEPIDILLFRNSLTKADAVLAAQSPAPIAREEWRCERRVRIQEALQATLGDTYDCTRVWSAWGYGTMGEDDFVPTLDRLEELVDQIDATVFPATARPSTQPQADAGSADHSSTREG